MMISFSVRTHRAAIGLSIVFFLRLASLLLVVGLFSGSFASAQTAHLSGIQSVIASGLGHPQGVAVDGKRNLYIADTNNNQVLELLWNGSSYGAPTPIITGLGGPQGIAVDGSGNLFISDTNNHQVLKETLSEGSYTPSVVASEGSGGIFGPVGVAVDVQGNVYIADYANNAVYENQTKIIAGLDHPTGVAVDAAGNLYIAGYNSGQAYKETLFDGSYTQSQIGSGFFDPDGIAVDSSGNVYIADLIGNVVEEPWTGSGYGAQLTLATGQFGAYGVGVDSSGNVYFANYVNSEILEVTTSAGNFGAVNIGSPSPVIALTFVLDTSGTIQNPVALTQGAANLDFNVTGGSCSAGTYSAPYTCTVNVTFTPKFAGLRYGAAVLQDSSGKVIATGYIYGTGAGPQIAFQPAALTNPVYGNFGTLFGTLFSLAVDGSGNIFVADHNNGVVRQIPPGCITADCVTAAGGGFLQPYGVAVDGSGNIFVADWAQSSVFEIPRGCGTADCVIRLGAGFNGPQGIAVDGSGNVFVASSDATVKELLAAGGYSTVNSLGSGFSYPFGIAVDGSGNVFVADNGDNTVKEIVAAGSYSTINPLGSGFSQPLGVAADGSGNVFVADSDAVKEILASSGYSTVNTLSNAFNPGNVAVDGSRNVFFIATNQMIKLDFADAPSLSFAPTNVGSASSPQTLVVENIGNAVLTFSGFGFPVDFSETISSDCSGSLAAGASCSGTVSFTPGQSGTLNEAISLTDDSLNAPTTQSITVSGVASLWTQAITVTGAPTTAIYGSSFTVGSNGSSGSGSITFEALGSCSNVGPLVTMTSGSGNCSVTAMIAADNNYSGATSAPATIGATQATAVVTIPPSSLTQTYSGLPEPVSVTTVPSPLALTYSYTGINGTNYAPSTTAPTNPGSYAVVATVFDPNYMGQIGGTLTINQLSPALSLALTSGESVTAPYGTTVTFAVGMASAPCPTGNVQLYVDGSASGSAFPLPNPCNGTVQLSTATMANGPHTIYVAYPGDTYYSSANTSTTALSYTVTPGSTTVTLAVDPATVNVGQQVTFTATVAPVTTDNGAPLAGSVQFFDGANPIGSPVALSGTSPYTATLNYSSLAEGSHNVSAIFADTDGNFGGSSSTALVETVNLIVPTIIWTPTPTQLIYGTPLGDGQLTATATDPNTSLPIPGAITFNYPSSTVLPIGQTNLILTFTPTDPATYAGATPSVTINVAPAVLTVTSDSLSMNYGAAVPTLTYEIGGFVNNESSTVVSGAATCSTTATSASPVASYPIACTVGSLAAANYTFQFVSGTLSVNRAPLTITANNQAKAYGAALPSLSASFTGFVNGDTFASLTTQPTLTTAATATSSVAGSPYAITASGAVGPNYAISYVPGNMTVTKAVPTITTWPTASSITYGQTLASSMLSGGVGSTAGGFAFATPTTAPGAGMASQSVTFTPTDATDYNTASASVSVTVNKATPTITTAPTASSITYGQTLASSMLSGGVGSTAGGFAFATPTTAPGAGMASQSVTFTPTDATDYNTASASVSVTVNKATPTITTAPTASSITYGQTLASSMLSGGVGSTAGGFAFATPTTAPGAGMASQSVTFTPTDATDYNTASASVSVTVNKATPTITWATPAAITYGTSLSGTQLNASSGNVAGSFVYTPATGSIPAVGSDTLSVTFTPADATDYAGATQTVFLTVGKAITTTTMQSSALLAMTQSNVTLTAHVSTSSAGTPAGSVSFMDGSTVLGTGTLDNSGAATLAISTLGVGQHNITAVYSGNVDYMVSTSSAITETVEDFTFSSGGTTTTVLAATVLPGNSAVYTLQLSPSSGSTFAGAVVLTLTGLPAGATYTITPSAISAGSSATVITVTINTAKTSASSRYPTGGFGFPKQLLLGIFLPLLGTRKLRRVLRQRMMSSMFILMMLSVVMVMGMIACGGGSSLPPVQTTAMTLTGTSGAVHHAVTLNLTIQ